MTKTHHLAHKAPLILLQLFVAALVLLPFFLDVQHLAQACL
jgi:hypothetical protein